MVETETAIYVDFTGRLGLDGFLYKIKGDYQVCKSRHGQRLKVYDWSRQVSVVTNVPVHWVRHLREDEDCPRFRMRLLEGQLSPTGQRLCLRVSLVYEEPGYAAALLPAKHGPPPKPASQMCVEEYLRLILLLGSSPLATEGIRWLFFCYILMLMQLFRKYPRRSRLVIALTLYLVGSVIGSLVDPLPWFDYTAFLGFLLIGLAVLLRSYLAGVIVFALGMFLLGYFGSARASNFLVLKEPLTYAGPARVTSVRFRTPPQQRMIVKLLDGPKRGAQVQVYGYDFTYSVGTDLQVATTITPSKYKSDRGRNVIGSSGDMKIAHVISEPSWIYYARAYMQSRLALTLPEPYASLAIGLLTGAGDDFDSSFKEDLQRTGTTHLVAVSGYNLTIVALFLQRLGRKRSRWLGLGLAVVSIVFYVILAGTNPSILRGAVVASLSLLAVTLGRPVHRLPLLLMGAVILSVITPLGMLYSLSWQLSFLAFAGILFFAPLITPFFTKWLGGIGATVAETLSAEVMTLPIILYQFGTLSVIAPLVNAVVLGFIPLGMALSASQTLLALIWLPLGKAVAWLTYPVLFLVIKPIQWASTIPFAAYDIGKIPFIYLMLSYVAVGVLFGVLTWNKPYVET